MPEHYWHPGYGEWRPVEPMKPSGWKARLEKWLRKHGMKKLAGIMADWDERGLG